jgi:O-acetyl-ADP-ribose deacetylase (regulator of RNase III)
MGENISAVWNKTKITIVKGDITEQNVDAIVNSANPSLVGGGGVDGAIHRKGGPAILEECKKIRLRYPGGLPRGMAVVTSAGKLKAKYVIHTVGPMWKGGNENEHVILSNCYKNSLSIAKELSIKSIAFPSISTGIYGYPIREASRVALRTVKDFVEREGLPEQVVFVLYSKEDMLVYVSSLEEINSSKR